MKPRFCLFMALAVGVTEIMNNATIAMLRLCAMVRVEQYNKVFSAIPETMPYNSE